MGSFLFYESSLSLEKRYTLISLNSPMKMYYCRINSLLVIKKRKIRPTFYWAYIQTVKEPTGIYMSIRWLQTKQNCYTKIIYASKKVFHHIFQNEDQIFYFLFYFCLYFSHCVPNYCLFWSIKLTQIYLVLSFLKQKVCPSEFN